MRAEVGSKRGADRVGNRKGADRVGSKKGAGRVGSKKGSDRVGSKRGADRVGSKHGADRSLQAGVLILRWGGLFGDILIIFGDIWNIFPITKVKISSK